MLHPAYHRAPPHTRARSDSAPAPSAPPPLALVGALTTCGVLCVGFGAFINGNKALAQNMMRARVAAQGLTVLAMVAAAGGTLFPKREEE